MSDISAAEWKKKLTSILEDLNHEQYGKLLETLDKIPKCQKEKSRENMPQIIMEHYGFDGSVAAIAEAMEEIPRRDPQIQGLLEPFVKKLEAKEGKRKYLDPQPEEEAAAAGSYSVKEFKTLKSGTGSVTGTVTEINPSKSVPVKNQEKKTERRQSFRIEDATDSIKVVFWGDKTQQCKDISVGDVITLNNVKISRYYGNETLQSTDTTDIIQGHKVGVRGI